MMERDQYFKLVIFEVFGKSPGPFWTSSRPVHYMIGQEATRVIAMRLGVSYMELVRGVGLYDSTLISWGPTMIPYINNIIIPGFPNGS